MKIIVAGLGYVGASTAVLLSAGNQVYAIDPDIKKTDALKKGKSPLDDSYMETLFRSGRFSIEVISKRDSVPEDADFVIIAVPTDWSEDTGSIDTHHIENVVRMVEDSHCRAAVVIRSTVPVGFTGMLAEKYPGRTFMICPEFLREGTALWDALHPRRLIIGRPEKDREAVSKANDLARIIKESLKRFRPDDYNEPPAVLFTGTEEAEAAKLFSNTYLAARIAFFNELDAFAEKRGLDSGQIVRCLCMDDRIGDYYNNPSFGYGGYCLPKDAKELLRDTGSEEGSILHAVVCSNELRKDSIANNLMAAASKASGQNERPVIGIYRLTAKAGSEGVRCASILDIMQRLEDQDVSFVVYEPNVMNGEQLEELLPQLDPGKLRLEKDLAAFKDSCHIIAANRRSEELEDMREKVYTRDIFGRN